MKIPFEKNLILLAERLDKPLYAVGGVVRNFLIDKSVSEDIDLASANSVEELLPLLKELNFSVVAEYKRTGTIVFKSENGRYEYTTFRRESYDNGGGHTPSVTEPTLDINEDARRRDFKCNAVYYDIKSQEIVDVLGGVKDIENRILDTVIEPEKVFKSDGLRLLRLARFQAELNFKPTKQVLSAMEKYADNILDISPERIYAELKSILCSDTKYPFSDKEGHYSALKTLGVTRVLDRIMPELTKGRGVYQSAEYHKYGVLEHSLKAVLYAPQEVRLAALLHDVGKPFCLERDDNFYLHAKEGVILAERILSRLKVDSATIKQVKFLVEFHMIDLDLSMKEVKVRRFIANNYHMINELFLLKQADFSASKDDLRVAPTIIKWKGVIEKMRKDGAPFCLKELKISAERLMEIGFSGKEIGEVLRELFDRAVCGVIVNEKSVLEECALKMKR